MPTNRDQPLADYVRKLIAEWEEKNGKGKLNILARQAGVAKSLPSQIKAGLGVGGRSLPGFARAFGMREDELKEQAYEWWLREGKRVAEMAAPPPEQYPDRARAIELAKTWRQAQDAEIRTIIALYGADEFASREFEWWDETLMRELKRMRDAAAKEAIQTKEERKFQAGIRAQQRKKSDAAQAPQTPAPVPATPVAHGKRKASA